MSNVRITAEVYGRPFDPADDSDAECFGVTYEGVPIKIDLDLWRCDRCAALCLRDDRMTHETWHNELDDRTRGDGS